MSLDSLFQHILLTEQQAQERRRRIQEVKSETNICHEKTRDVTKKLEEAKEILESKVCLLSERVSQRDLLKKRLVVLESQKDDLLKEKGELLTMHQELKKEMAEEEDTFMREVMDFNSSYGLTSNREILVQEKAKAEADLLDTEADILRSEMESMEQENLRLNTLQLAEELDQSAVI